MPWGLSKSPRIKSKFSDLQDKYKNTTILQGYQEDELRIFWRYLYAVKHTNAIYFAGHSSKNHSKFSFPPKMTKEKYKEGFR